MPVVYQPKIAHDKATPKRGKRRVVWLDRAARARRRAMLARSIDAMANELATVQLQADQELDDLYEAAMGLDDERVWIESCRAATTSQSVNELCTKLAQVGLLSEGPLFDLEALGNALSDDILPDITDQLLRYLDRVSTTLKTTPFATTTCASAELTGAAVGSYLKPLTPDDNNELTCVCPLDVFLPPSDFDSSTDDSDSDSDLGFDPATDDDTDADSDSASSSSDMVVDFFVEQSATKPLYGCFDYATSESEFESEVEASQNNAQSKNRLHARSISRKSRGFHPFARPSTSSDSDSSASPALWTQRRSPSLQSRPRGLRY